MEPFPNCGCDACDDTAEGEIERLTEMIDNVVAGRFREAIQPMISPTGSARWVTEFWSDTGGNGRDGAISRENAERMTGGRQRLDLDWKPWPRRQAGG